MRHATRHGSKRCEFLGVELTLNTNSISYKTPNIISTETRRAFDGFIAEQVSCAHVARMVARQL